MQTKELRSLSVKHQKRVDRIFNSLATLAANRPHLEAVILDRNKYVDSTIADLLDMAALNVSPECVELHLLAAFAFWIDRKELDDVRWPLTQFEKAFIGAAAACESEKSIREPKWARAIEAYHKFGGAR
jgi:hypothetical protein